MFYGLLSSLPVSLTAHLPHPEISLVLGQHSLPLRKATEGGGDSFKFSGRFLSHFLQQKKKTFVFWESSLLNGPCSAAWNYGVSVISDMWGVLGKRGSA